MIDILDEFDDGLFVPRRGAVLKRYKPRGAREHERGGRCRNGHDMTEGNYYQRKDGRKDCKMCRKLSAEKYEAKRSVNRILTP